MRKRYTKGMVALIGLGIVLPALAGGLPPSLLGAYALNDGRMLVIPHPTAAVSWDRELNPIAIYDLGVTMAGTASGHFFHGHRFVGGPPLPDLPDAPTPPAFASQRRSEGNLFEPAFEPAWPRLVGVEAEQDRNGRVGLSFGPSVPNNTLVGFTQFRSGRSENWTAVRIAPLSVFRMAGAFNGSGVTLTLTDANGALEGTLSHGDEFSIVGQRKATRGWFNVMAGDKIVGRGFLDWKPAPGSIDRLRSGDGNARKLGVTITYLPELGKPALDRTLDRS